MTLIKQHIQHLVERRRIERRQPFAALQPEDAFKIIKDVQYTGHVVVHYAQGVMQEIEFPAAPMRILLDKSAGSSGE